MDARTSNRAKASEMEHAARYHINQSYQQDPAYYKKLSKRLEEILESFQNQWEELVAALRQFTQEVRSGRSADDTGLDPSTQAPFLSILVEEAGGAGDVSQQRLSELAAITVEMVDHIRQQI